MRATTIKLEGDLLERIEAVKPADRSLSAHSGGCCERIWNGGRHAPPPPSSKRSSTPIRMSRRGWPNGTAPTWPRSLREDRMGDGARFDVLDQPGRHGAAGAREDHTRCDRLQHRTQRGPRQRRRGFLSPRLGARSGLCVSGPTTCAERQRSRYCPDSVRSRRPGCPASSALRQALS